MCNRCVFVIAPHRGTVLQAATQSGGGIGRTRQGNNNSYCQDNTVSFYVCRTDTPLPTFGATHKMTNSSADWSIQSIYLPYLSQNAKSGGDNIDYPSNRGVAVVRRSGTREGANAMQPYSIRPHGTRVALRAAAKVAAPPQAQPIIGAQPSQRRAPCRRRCSHRLGATAKPARYLLALLAIVQR
jgi:hypothetical protein